MMGWMKACLFGRLTMWPSKKTAQVAVASATTGVPELTLLEVNKDTSCFSAAMVIGQGESATVYRATLPIGSGSRSGKAAAAKRIRIGSASGDELLRQKVLVLSRLRHDNLVRLLGYTIDTTANVRVLLFEFADMGTLHDVLHGPAGKPAAEPSISSSRRPALSWAQRTGIALDVARGLEYMHDVAAMSHLGISSTKVLLFQGFRAKIGYALFVELPPDDVTYMVTVDKAWYKPPEYYRIMSPRSSGSPKLDVYSYGILLLELLTGRNGYADGTPSPQKLLEWADPILRDGRVEQFMDPKIGTQYPPARALKLARIALCCVQENPEFRPSMGDVAQAISCHIVSSEHNSQVG